jgi:hypothetical protein
MPAWDKHYSLLSPFVSYGENRIALWELVAIHITSCDNLVIILKGVGLP